VVVLFIPVVLSLSCTLIGTSTNIIGSDLAAHYGYDTIGMFELSVVGIPIAVAGLAMIILMAPRLMPDLLNPTCELQNDRRRYLAELLIPRESPFLGYRQE
jgi:di/tricarboxylate transporter